MKQGMGQPGVFSRFVSTYLHDLTKEAEVLFFVCLFVFTGIDVKVACELNICGSILVCRDHTRMAEEALSFSD